MKRKTSDTPKIPSEKASPKGAETKGILASAPTATSSPLTPFQELIEEWLDYCKVGGLAPKTLLDYRKGLETRARSTSTLTSCAIPMPVLGT